MKRCIAMTSSGNRCRLRTKYKETKYCPNHTENEKRCVQLAKTTNKRCERNATLGDICTTHFNEIHFGTMEYQPYYEKKEMEIKNE